MSGSGITSAKAASPCGTAATTYYAMYLDQRTFNNSGAAQFRSSSSAGGYYTNLTSPAVPFRQHFYRQSHFTSDYTNFQSNGGTPSGGTFQNDGSLTKQGTSGSSAIGSGITFNDIAPASLGLIRHARSRVVMISSSSTSRSPAGSLDFNGATFTVSSAINATGAAVVSFSGGTANISGSTGSRVDAYRTGGTFNYAAATTATLGALTETSGTPTGTGTINVSGSTELSGGTMSGSGITSRQGRPHLAARPPPPTRHVPDQRTFNNPGAAPGAAPRRAVITPTFTSPAVPFSDNTSTGSLIFTSDYTNFQSNGGNPSGGTSPQNDGSLTKQGTSGSSAIGSGITFNDIGSASLSVSSGTLSLQGGGTISSSSTVQVASAGSLDFNGATTASSAINATAAAVVSLGAPLGDEMAPTGAGRVDAWSPAVRSTMPPRRRPPWGALTENQRHANRHGHDQRLARPTGPAARCRARASPTPRAASPWRHGRHHLLRHAPGSKNLQHPGAAQFRAAPRRGGYYTNLYLSSGALFDNTLPAVSSSPATTPTSRATAELPQGATFQPTAH